MASRSNLLQFLVSFFQQFPYAGVEWVQRLLFSPDKQPFYKKWFQQRNMEQVCFYYMKQTFRKNAKSLFFAAEACGFLIRAGFDARVTTEMSKSL